MPPVAAAIAVWAGITIQAAYVLMAVVVITAGMAVYGSAQARKAERQARDALNAGMKDRMATRIATEAAHRYIYGRAKVGADIVAMFTTGDKDQFRHLVCVHAAHECDEIEEVYVNNVAVGVTDLEGDPTGGRYATEPDRQIAEEAAIGPEFKLARTPLPGSIWVFSGAGAKMVKVNVLSQSGRTITVNFTGPVLVTYEYRVAIRLGIGTPIEAPVIAPAVRVRKHLGGPSDTVDAYLTALLGDRWPATSVLRGLCYTVITLDLNRPEFQGGLVPIHALIRGRKLYDPRDGQTRWSQNPALVLMDYLTSPLCGVPMSELPAAQFITAANVCDEAGNIPAEPRYTINGTVASDQAQSTVLEAMAQAMAGGLIATTWDVYAGKYVAPVAALVQADIVGGLSVTPGVSDASIYNGVKGQYIAPENKYVMTDFKPYQNATYREADERDLYTNIDLPFTDSLQRVTNLARIFTEDQRNGYTIKAEFSLKAWPLKVGQRITFTSQFLGQQAKVYRITDKAYSPNSAVQLTLKEDDASIWDFADATVVDATPNSDLPDPWTLDPLASISCTSGEATLLRQSDGSTVPRILASWPAVAQANGVQIEVEWRAVSSPTWERTTVSAGETQAYLSPITPGFFYVVRARIANPSLNVYSRQVATVYQVAVVTASPTVWRWGASKPAAPSGMASYVWSNGTFGAAPAGWSLAVPAAPAGAAVSLWAAFVSISDVGSVSTPFDWAQAEVGLVDQNVAANLIAAATTAQWSGVGGTGKPADNASSDLVLTPAGTVTVTGNRVVKTSGVAAWDSSVTSKDGYIGGAYVIARVDIPCDTMIGLNADPATNASWDTLDFAIATQTNGLLLAYESGGGGVQIGSYVAGDVVTVVYDGSAVRYIKNGAVLRSTAIAAPITNPLFLDSSLHSVGASLSNIRFGPLSSNNWGNIGGTGKPQDGATVGAPAGTNVAGVLAETVVAKANNAVAAAPTFALNPYFESEVYGASGSTLSASFSVNPTGYTGSYSVRWMLTRLSGGPSSQGPFLSGASGNTVSASAAANIGRITYEVTVIVTHSGGLTASASGVCALNFGSS